MTLAHSQESGCCLCLRLIHVYRSSPSPAMFHHCCPNLIRRETCTGTGVGHKATKRNQRVVTKSFWTLNYWQWKMKSVLKEWLFYAGKEQREIEFISEWKFTFNVVLYVHHWPTLDQKMCQTAVWWSIHKLLTSVMGISLWEPPESVRFCHDTDGKTWEHKMYVNDTGITLGGRT